MSEKPDWAEWAFQENVKDLAKKLGWAVHHVSPHMVRQNVYRSDTPGWPDLTLIRRHSTHTELIFAELKTNTGRVDERQKHWLSILSGAAETYLWRPMHWDLIVGRLGSTDPGPEMKVMQWVSEMR